MGAGTESLTAALFAAEFAAPDYDLAATLDSGQAFRWRRVGGGWEGVVHGRWIRLSQLNGSIRAETTTPPSDWAWLRHYLQLDIDFPSVLAAFPDDEPLRLAAAACPGLRLLRQDPWECLVSFICSSTKQITQIRQIIDLLCRNYGAPVEVPAGAAPAFAFPTCQAIAEAGEAGLRACKLGFRAPYLLATARKIHAEQTDWHRLSALTLAEARLALREFPGVGPKIADCVLLFAHGFQEAFPVDVWVLRALMELYFPGRRPGLPRVRRFSETYFGPHAGFAQQYLFHYMRTQRPRRRAVKGKRAGKTGSKPRR